MFDFLLFFIFFCLYLQTYTHTHNRHRESFINEHDPSDVEYNPADDQALRKRPKRAHNPVRRNNGGSKKHENKKLVNKKNVNKKNENKKNENKKNETNGNKKDGNKKDGNKKDGNKKDGKQQNKDNDAGGAHSSDEDENGQWTETELRWKRWCKDELTRNDQVMKYLRKFDRERPSSLTKKAVQQVKYNFDSARALDYNLEGKLAKKPGRRKATAASKDDKHQPKIDQHFNDKLIRYGKTGSQENNNDNNNNENGDITVETRGDGGESDRTESIDIVMKENKMMAQFNRDAKARQIADLRNSQNSYVFYLYYVLYVLCIFVLCIDCIIIFVFFLYYVLIVLSSLCVFVLCIMDGVISFFFVLFHFD